MESTRPIRALQRGLEAIAALNRLGGASVAELVAAVRLPRTTVYRVLETLVESGYVHRDATDERFRLTQRVRALADSFDDVARLAGVAERHLEALSATLPGPVGFATACGSLMHVRLMPVAGGPIESRHVPMAGSAWGLAYLAHCAPAEREAQARARSRAPAPDLPASLAAVAAQGHALAAGGSGNAGDFVVALPVQVSSSLVGVLGAGTGPATVAPAGTLEALRVCAASIREQFVDPRSGTCLAGTPAAAH